MSYIETVREDQAEGPVADTYERANKVLGYVPNYTKAFSHRPALYEAWVTLNSTIWSAMDPRRYELATLAAAVRRRSTYCTVAHSERLRKLGSSAEEIRAMASDPTSAPLDNVEKAIVAYAAKVAEAPHTVTEGDIEDLRSVGLTDTEIFDVASAVAARLFFTALGDGLGVQADSVYRDSMADLVDELSVGRPVAIPADTAF